MATTANGVPYPLGTDLVRDGDDAIKALAQWVDDMQNTRVRLYRTALFAVASGTDLTIPWDTEDIDPQGLHAAGSGGIITAARAGRYRVFGQICWINSGAGQTGLRRCNIKFNNVDFQINQVPASPPGQNTMQVFNVTGLLTVGQGPIIVVNQNSGASVNIGAGNSAISSTFVECEWVGAV